MPRKNKKKSGSKHRGDSKDSGSEKSDSKHSSKGSSKQERAPSASPSRSRSASPEPKKNKKGTKNPPVSDVDENMPQTDPAGKTPPDLQTNESEPLDPPLTDVSAFPAGNKKNRKRNKKNPNLTTTIQCVSAEKEKISDQMASLIDSTREEYSPGGVFEL